MYMVSYLNTPKMSMEALSSRWGSCHYIRAENLSLPVTGSSLSPKVKQGLRDLK